MKKIYAIFIALVLLVSFATFAQTYDITGKVTDGTTGEVLIGANVFLKGTSWGAASDANGIYSIVAPAGTIYS